MACRLASVAAATLLCTLAVFRGCQSSEVQQQELSRLLMDRPWLYRYLMRSKWPTPLVHDGELPLEPPPELALNADSPDEDDDKDRAEKRSAVATALNTGRRRRQPTPPLGKAVTPYVGVGVLNNMGSFFDSLRDNLETLAALSPQQRATLLADPPTVVNANSHGVGSGSGSGIRRLHALRPLRPTGNIRSYNRRSLMDSEIYPGANHHDPELLWTGLGR